MEFLSYLNMTYVIGVIIFMFGLIFGSFFNVIIYRVPIDKQFVKGSSICPHCNADLKATDLIPLLSWVFLLGKCRYCKHKISIRYPIVELTTALLFVLAYVKFGLSIEALLYVSLWSMLLVTAVIDFDHMIICDSILIAFSLIGLVCVVLLKNDLLGHLIGALSGFAVYFIIYFVAKLVYKKEAFGFGDVLLMCSVGLFLGWKNALLACMAAFWVAIIFVAVFRIPFKNADGEKKEIPFGPSICIASFIISLYGNEIIALYIKYFF